MLLMGCGGGGSNSPDAANAGTNGDAREQTDSDRSDQTGGGSDGDVAAIRPQARPNVLDAAPPTPHDISQDLARPANLEQWRRHRDQLNNDVWLAERQAQEYEQTFVRLWDAMLDLERANQRQDIKDVLASFPMTSIRIGAMRLLGAYDHDITVHEFAEPAKTLDPVGWSALLDTIAGDGTQVFQSEFHHAGFEPATADRPARSQFSLAIYLFRQEPAKRMVLQGLIDVQWTDQRDADGYWVADTIDATGLKLLSREGGGGFRRHATVDPSKLGPNQPPSINPVLLYDVNRDGNTDIIMGGFNRILWNQGGGELKMSQFVNYQAIYFETGVMGDINGDSYPDYMTVAVGGGPLVYLGDANGEFSEVPKGNPESGLLELASTMSLGDSDGDGDLDLWIGQYKPALRGGQMPTPYYDANDGYPAFLLHNDGAGNLTDATHRAGLTNKRHRRSYAGSFIDLDKDLDMDLVVISDFSGVDLYRNDGKGSFTDITSELTADRHLFGMSATFGDYNLDGELDFFVTGMGSTTARRLEKLGLGRDDRPDIQQMRMRMGYGNRMYLGSGDTWVEPGFRDQVARTGWSWGTTTFDFDNDGDSDIFVANGHLSGTSTKDHCTQFWCHDIYDGTSELTSSLNNIFAQDHAGLTDGSESWDGYQKNNLLMNLDGLGFVNIAFLLGVADQFDTRAAVSGDINGDGRMDLVITQDSMLGGQKLHVYLNTLETGNNWIGIRLQEEGGGFSPIGARVELTAGGRTRMHHIVTGETLFGQHEPVAHFGLGDLIGVDKVVITWPNGTQKTLTNPAINAYHTVKGRERQAQDRPR